MQEQTARSPVDTGNATAEEELLVSGLRTYFNRSCRLLLLYPQERQQAEVVRSRQSDPVRLFYRAEDVLVNACPFVSC